MWCLGAVEGSPKLPVGEEGVLGWIGPWFWYLGHFFSRWVQEVNGSFKPSLDSPHACFLRRIWTKDAVEARQAPLAAPGLPAAMFS